MFLTALLLVPLARESAVGEDDNADAHGDHSRPEFHVEQQCGRHCFL
jgi:hypothetical protein